MLRWIIVSGIVIVIAAAAYLSTTKSRPVDTAVASRGAITRYVEERATTRLPRTYRVTMPIDGRIMPIDLREGDPVRADQIVAQIEMDDLETTVAMARARVDQLTARIEENRDSRLERSTLELLDDFLESMDRTVEASQAQTESSKAREEYRTHDLERMREKRERSAATPREVEVAELADIESRVQYRSDILNLRALEAIRRAAQIWPRQVRQMIEKKQLTEAILQKELAEAQAAYDQAVRDRERAVIRSPIDGVVLERVISSRRLLPAGEVLLDIGRLADLEVEAEVLSQDAVEIQPDDPVEIFGPAIGAEPVRGHVSRVEPQGFTKISSLGVEQQRVRVIIAFDEGELARLQGEGRTLGAEYRVRARIITDRREDAVVIPRSALFRGTNDHWQAFVIRDGRARLVDLEVGLMNESQVQVIGGVEPGEAVILAPETDLEDGDRVNYRAQM